MNSPSAGWRRLLAAVFALTLAACTDGDGAIHTLMDAGYTNIMITGKVWFGVRV